MKKTLLFILFYFSFSLLYSQNSKVKAILTYNFTKFLEWEDTEKDSTNFTIGVIGDGDFKEHIKMISKNYKVSGKEIQILEFDTLKNITNCNILYVTENLNYNIQEIIKKILGNNTLLITSEAQGLSNNLGINFVIIDGKQNFEVYSKNIEKANIKISEKLLKLGINK